jgi:hypothetical protein
MAAILSSRVRRAKRGLVEIWGHSGPHRCGKLSPRSKKNPPPLYLGARTA